MTCKRWCAPRLFDRALTAAQRYIQTLPGAQTRHSSSHAAIILYRCSSVKSSMIANCAIHAKNSWTVPPCSA